LVFATAAAAAVSLATVLWASPQVLLLLSEGYPPLTFDEDGRHATVAGNALPVGRASLRPMTPRLTELFEATRGEALIVLNHGQIELEHYAPGFDAATRFNSFSAVKSLVGVLVLKAVAEGRIAGLDQPIAELLPASTEGGAGRVTVRQLLDMTSGLNFEPGRTKEMSGVDEKPVEQFPYNPFGALAKLHALGLEEVLPQLRRAPEEAGTFRYQNINTALLGALLEQVYALPLAELLSTTIWKPARAGEAAWRLYPKSGKATPYCCLFATAADWALVGRYLMLNGGETGPFLPDELWRYWIGTDIADADRLLGVYRSQMRYDVLDRAEEKLAGPFAYFIGQGGQVVYLKPDEDLVVVRFGDGIQLLHSTLYEAVK
jgi:CubicO group peptidase (beta-lactamase class C family)